MTLRCVMCYCVLEKDQEAFLLFSDWVLGWYAHEKCYLNACITATQNTVDQLITQSFHGGQP